MQSVFSNQRSAIHRLPSALSLDPQALAGALMSIATYYRLRLDRWLVVSWQEPHFSIYISYRPGNEHPLTGWLETLRSGPENRRDALEMSRTWDQIVQTDIRAYLERLELPGL
jgi:hypothetical protein